VEDGAGDTADEASALRKRLHTEPHACAPGGCCIGCQHQRRLHHLLLLGQLIAATREGQGEDQHVEENKPAAAGEGRGLLVVEQVQQRAAG